jgi:hypothetical protein
MRDDTGDDDDDDDDDDDGGTARAFNNASPTPRRNHTPPRGHAVVIPRPRRIR